MKTAYRYSLSKSPKKHPCPNCHQKRFKHYVDNWNNGEIVLDSGRCDRQDSCGYHQPPPRQETRQNTPQALGKVCHIKHNKPVPVVLIPDTELEALRAPDAIRESQFFKNMVNHGFTESLVFAALNLYRVGTLDGRTAFPYIDRNGEVRAVSLIEYGENGHRIKDSNNKPDWLHNYRAKKYSYDQSRYPLWLFEYINFQQQGGKIVGSLFGEHLLGQFPNNPLKVVEAPKTAIIATLYSGIPQDEKTPIWVAVGAKDWLTDERLNLLARQGYRRPCVVLYPDLGAEEAWNKKIKNGRVENLISISDLVTKHATEEDRIRQLDLGDLLVRRNPNLKQSESESERISAESEQSERSEDSHKENLGESLKKMEKSNAEKSGNRAINSNSLPELQDESLPVMRAYAWESGDEGRTYLMPDDQKWSIKILAPFDNRKRQELMREHQRLFLDTYHQTAGSNLRKDEIARRAANSWLLDITSNKI